MNTITVNGTTFTAEMILDAVERTTGFPESGMDSIWYPHQLVTSQEYDSIKKEMRDRQLKLIEERGMSTAQCYSTWETNLGGWRFLYVADSRGDWHTECFSF